MKTYTIVYNMNGIKITETRNSLKYAMLLAKNAIKKYGNAAIYNGNHLTFKRGHI